MLTQTGNRRRMLAGMLALILVLGLFRSGLVQPALAATTGNPFADFDIGSNGELTRTPSSETMNMQGVVNRYKTIALALTSVLTITMLIFMLLQFTKLGAAGDNEMARKRAIMGILTTGIATALLGGATIIIGFFWNALVNTAP